MQKQESPTYLKAITIRDSSDIHTITEDIKKGMVLILRVTPLAQKDVKKLRKMVEELYAYSKYYKNIISAENDSRHGKPTVNSALHKLRNLDAKPTHGVLMGLLKHVEDEVISEEDFIKMIKTIEAWAIRRIVCKYELKMNKVFPTMTRDIDEVLVENNYLEAFISVLTNSEAKQKRFPSDSEFEASFVSFKLYEFKGKNHIFDALEGHNNKESVNVVSKIKKGELSIEHIVPQGVMDNSGWCGDLGDEVEDIAGAALYLAADTGSWITGQALVLDGGGQIKF